MSRRLALQQVVDESMIHIIEPVATQAVRYIVNRLGIYDMMQNNIHIVSDFKETSRTVDENNNPILLDNRVMAKLTPSVNPKNNKWEGMKTAIDLGNGNTLLRTQDVKAVKRPWSGRDITGVNYSVLHDNDLFMDLTECNVGASLALEVRLIFQNLSDAQRTLSTLFAAFTNGEMIGYIPIQYDYPIPKAIQNVMKYFYSISDHEQTTEKFIEWIKDKSKDCLGANTNRNDLRNLEMVGKKNNVNALFLIECGQDAPEPVQPSCYQISFTLTVQYSRCNQMVLDYPIIANNTLVDVNYVPMPAGTRKMTAGPIMWQNRAVDEYWHQQYGATMAHPIVYPWWDRWIVPNDSIIMMKGFRPIMSVALTLDDLENPEGVTEIDIQDDLPGYSLRQDILDEFMKSKSKALQPYGKVNISVFAHDFQVDTDLLEFDGRKLTIKSRRKEPIYRMVISLNEKPVNQPQINWVWLTTIIVKREGK